MMLLPRLRYILEVCQPSLDVTSKIFEILIRIARQSLNASSQVCFNTYTHMYMYELYYSDVHVVYTCCIYMTCTCVHVFMTMNVNVLMTVTSLYNDVHVHVCMYVCVYSR